MTMNNPTATLTWHYDPFDGGWFWRVKTTTATDPNAEQMRGCYMGRNRTDAEAVCRDWNIQRGKFGFPALTIVFRAR